MDPRLKLQYYKENKWKSTYYISQVKAEVTEIWNNTYKNSNLDIESSDNNADDDILSHVFKNRRTENDELASYLKEPVIPNKTDVLLWWKVNIIN